MKIILPIVALLTTAPFVSAQYVVTNPISDVLSEEMHLEDIGKWVQSIENQVQQIETLTQQLQQVQAYVKAFGDPEKLLNIVGADQLISSLQQTGVGQTIGQVQQLATGVQALGYSANGLYQSLGTTFTTPGGTQVPRLEDSIVNTGLSSRARRTSKRYQRTCKQDARPCANRSPPRRSNFRPRRLMRRRKS